jgi:1-acyl-sn-glycerol-3-phosphate acyltransferase
MLRTIVALTLFWIFLLLSMPFLLPLLPLSLPGLEKGRQRYVLAIATVWARFVLLLGGVRVEVHGLERLPEAENICFVANHQSYFDIPLIMARIPRLIGFIAKKELRYVPFLSSWMRAMGCLFLDRGNPRQAREVYARAVEDVKAGRSKMVFPEGTRSRGPEIGRFKTGALKLAFRSESLVVPISIDGSYRLLEEHGKITPGTVVLTVHEPVSVAGLSREEQQQTTRRIEATIAAALPAAGKGYSGRDSRNSQRA